MKTTSLVKLFVWLAICQLPSLLGMQFVYIHMAWYKLLAKPPFVPPDAVFGMVWAVLYVMLGLSAFFAFREKLHGHALMLFVGQLALNACWTPVFFGAQSILGGVLLLAAMLVETYFLFTAYWKINHTASWLLVPYGLWLAFATYLTAGVWWLN